jgi:hypothetical protein
VPSFKVPCIGTAEAKAFSPHSARRKEAKAMPNPWIDSVRQTHQLTYYLSGVTGQ